MTQYEYRITQADIADAENFLVQFQREKVPEANLDVGGAVRDLLIKGFAFMYAYLRGEIDRVTARQSLLRMREELDDSQDIAPLVDEILSNWFVSRRGGTYATVFARMHFTQRATQRINAGTQFWKTADLLFVPDTGGADQYVISEAQQFPVYDFNGLLVEYIADVPLKASRPGTDYLVSPGTFLRVTSSGTLPFFSYAETVEEASGGIDVESTEDLIQRASTAISVRNLVNSRSCDVVLQERFPDIIDTMTIGMGEIEMVRDLRKELGTHISLHTGGHYDTYVDAADQKHTESGIVGSLYPRPDNLTTIFRDPALTHGVGNTFTSLGILAGHILYLLDGVKGAPQAYRIVRADAHEIEVSTTDPFQEATDEALVNDVHYSVGWTSPAFADVEFTPGQYSRVAAAHGTMLPGTSRRVQQSGKLLLSGRPIQNIEWVECTNPTAAMADIIDPATSTVVFAQRTNATPIVPVEPSLTQYRLTVANPTKAQSMYALNFLEVGSEFDGLNLQVTYTTLQNFSQIHTYVMDRNQRLVTANHLLRARNPVWITVNVPYRLRRTASMSLDEAAAADVLARSINTFDSNDTLDVSDLSTTVRQNFPAIGAVFPLEVFYNLDAPDGQQAYFSTTDILSIFMTAVNGVVLENGLDLATPSELLQAGKITTPTIRTAGDLQAWYYYLGITDRTVTYKTRPDLITFEQRDD